MRAERRVRPTTREVVEDAIARSKEGGVKRWTGPNAEDLMGDGVTLLRPVPPERWPFGLPDEHESCCVLHRGALFCDCKASAADAPEFGERA